VRLLYVVNQPRFFMTHRLPVARAAAAEGFEVHVATPDGPEAVDIQAEGFRFHPIPMSRKGIHPLEELTTCRAIVALYRALRPDLVHHVTIKPVLYGSLAARLARVPAVVNAVTGLGHLFVDRRRRTRALRWIVERAYGVAFSHPNGRAIFQNQDDLAGFVRTGRVRPADAVVIRGSGVDTARFAPRPEPAAPPFEVVLIARMLWSKGIGAFVEAARTLRAQGVPARFVLIGDSDPGNPASIPSAQLSAWHRSGVVEWRGHCDDIPGALAAAHLVCLPTAYGEGVPKALIEAAAAGRAIVATDVPGCREIVRSGENGVLVPAGDTEALAHAVHTLLEDPHRRAAMGARGREIAEKEFSEALVVEQTLAVYRTVLRT
jgi:glycosyltransferase involved in cell wall biosynthesis